MAWQNPKTNWGAADGVRNTDFNRIEGNILELYNTGAVRDTLTVYVSTSGNDTTGSGTSASPYRTITKALSVLPKNLNGKTVTISVASGTYAEDVTIKDFTGGAIIISGSSPVNISSLTITNSLVKVNYINFVTSGSVGISINDGATFITLGNVTTSGSSYGISVTGCASAFIGGILTVTGATIAVNASNNSDVYVSSVSLSGVSTAFSADNGSQIAYGSSNLSNTSGLISTRTGGRVLTGSQGSTVMSASLE